MTLVLLLGCSGTRIKTYTNPSFSRESYQKYALLPIRNISLSPSEGLEVNKTFLSTLMAKNPGKKILNSVDVNRILNESNSVSIYDQFLREFENTGLPNTNILNTLGKQLNCDAIIQGIIVNFKQESYPRSRTTAGLRYVIISTKNGDILWESQSSGYKNGAWAWSQPPPLFDVLGKIQKKMVRVIPSL